MKEFNFNVDIPVTYNKATTTVIVGQRMSGKSMLALNLATKIKEKHPHLKTFVFFASRHAGEFWDESNIDISEMEDSLYDSGYCNDNEFNLKLVVESIEKDKLHEDITKDDVSKSQHLVIFEEGLSKRKFGKIITEYLDRLWLCNCYLIVTSQCSTYCPPTLMRHADEVMILESTKSQVKDLKSQLKLEIDDNELSDMINDTCDNTDLDGHKTYDSLVFEKQTRAFRHFKGESIARPIYKIVFKPLDQEFVLWETFSKSDAIEFASKLLEHYETSDKCCETIIESCEDDVDCVFKGSQMNSKNLGTFTVLVKK